MFSTASDCLTDNIISGLPRHAQGRTHYLPVHVFGCLHWSGGLLQPSPGVPVDQQVYHQYLPCLPHRILAVVPSRYAFVFEFLVVQS